MEEFKMKKLNIIKKVISILCVLTFTFITLPLGNYVSAMTGVYLGISAPSNYNPKAGGSVTFTLSYTGDVYNIYLPTGAVVLNGFTANISISGTGNTRTLTLSNLQGVGSNKSVTITGGTAVDRLGTLSNMVTSGKFTINEAAPVDTTSPVLSVTGPNINSIYAGQTVSYTANYSDNVGITNIYLPAGAIVLNGFTANISVSGTGNTRTITLSNVQGAIGDKSITITGGTGIDAAGNLSNLAKSSTFKLVQKPVADTTPPVLTITGPNINSIYAGQTVSYTANYSDNVGITNIYLPAGAIVLNGFTANISVSGTGNTRTITLSNVQGTIGDKSITITGGTGIDAAGNLSNLAKSPIFKLVQKPVEGDTVAPVLTITGPNFSSIYAGQSVTYTAVYTDDIGVTNISLLSNSILLNGFTADIRISGIGNTRIITLSNIQGTIGGSKYISIVRGTAIDAAGNLANAATSLSFSIKKDEEEKPKDWVPNPNTGRE
jgi:hypothetical protein